MLHEIAVELGARLRALGCPVPVVDGPEPTKTTTGARERIVLEHDDAGDRFDSAQAQRGTPTHVRARVVAAKATIYAQSTKAGAHDFEHRRRCEHTLDLVIAGLNDVIAARKNRVEFTGGRFVKAEDLTRSEVIPGAIYELTFTFDRAVRAQRWDYDLAPTLELEAGLIHSTTQVTGPGVVVPETNCGE